MAGAMNTCKNGKPAEIVDAAERIQGTGIARRSSACKDGSMGPAPFYRQCKCLGLVFAHSAKLMKGGTTAF